MATYNFATMTAGQAFEIGEQDTVEVASTASRTTVLFNENGTFTVTVEDRTLVFGLAFRQVANSLTGQWAYPDGSRLHVGDGNPNTFNLTPNPNVVRGGAAYGGAGNDVFDSNRGSWLIQGNQGNDLVRLAGGSNTVYGGQDNDRIELNQFVDSSGVSGQNFAQGNRGEDTVIGAGRSDTLLGGQGNDVLDGQGGQDFINGNLGDDNITGNGQLFGEGGSDVITGGAESSNVIHGGDGDDQLIASAVTVGGVRRGATNTLFGDAGDDFIRSDSPAGDTMFGGAGNDVLSGSGNDDGQFDQLSGEDGDDVLATKIGDDLLRGGAGADSLNAGEGADTLDGGTGADTLTGGAGGDLFVLTGHTDALTFAAADRITDWQAGDHIQLRTAVATAAYAETSAGDFAAAVAAAQGMIGGGSIEVVAVQVGGDVVIFADASTANVVDVASVLVGRSLTDIAGDNFV
jgi:Ca2+-binding RTX toxin-like protein